MKIFHTGDWHIGKMVNGFYMTEDQAFVMEQLFEAVEREKPDVLLVAGDLYDRSVPPVQAIELLNKVLGRIVRDLGTPIIALAGNHDSNERIDFASRLLSDSGLYISGTLQQQIQPVILKDGFGPVHFYPVPYADPPVVRELYQDESIRTHDDAMGRVMKDIRERMDHTVRNVAIAHGYVTSIGSDGTDTLSLEQSESEKMLTIGGTACVNASHFDGFSYTALGHLHGPQKVGGDRMRYSGSLLKYSFSEVNQRKGITVVDMDKEGNVEIGFIAFRPRRDMRIIKGELKELVSANVVQAENNEDYIKAVLTDKGELLDPIGKLRSVYPNVMELVREERLAGAQLSGEQRVSVKNRSELNLFESFYKDMTGSDCDETGLEVIRDVIEEVRRDVEQR